MDDWKKVAWSDESRFLVHYVDGRAWIHGLPTEAVVPGCTVGWNQDSGSIVVSCAMFSWDTLDPIIPTAQSLIAARSLNIVVDQVQPLMATLIARNQMKTIESIVKK